MNSKPNPVDSKFSPELKKVQKFELSVAGKKGESRKTDWSETRCQPPKFLGFVSDGTATKRNFFAARVASSHVPMRKNLDFVFCFLLWKKFHSSFETNWQFWAALTRLPATSVAAKINERKWQSWLESRQTTTTRGFNFLLRSSPLDSPLSLSLFLSFTLLRFLIHRKHVATRTYTLAPSLALSLSLPLSHYFPS